MSFLNKIEEVFELTITEAGRRKLSKGKFKPYSYSFYDNEIIYDKQYADDLTELQNDAEPRIKNTLMTQEKVVWDDVKTGTNEKNQLNYPTYFELGTYEYTQQNKPAWKVNLRAGTITGSIKQFPIELEKAGKVTTLDDYRHDKIPQLNVFCEYEIYVDEKTIKKDGEFKTIRKVYVRRKEDDLKFNIDEENVFDDRENFIMEVFQFSKNMRELKKLDFANEEDAITPNNVEHFFNITVDTENVLSINYSDTLQELEMGLEDEFK